MASLQHDISSQHNNVPISSDIVKDFLANQSKEIELKKQVEENKKQSLKYDYELAKQSLQAQVEDLKEIRTHQKILWKWGLLFGGFLSILLVHF